MRSSTSCHVLPPDHAFGLDPQLYARPIWYITGQEGRSAKGRLVQPPPVPMGLKGARHAYAPKLVYQFWLESHLAMPNRVPETGTPGPEGLSPRTAANPWSNPICLG